MKKTKKIRVQNHAFVPFVIILSGLFVATVILQAFFYSRILCWNQKLFNALGVASQITTAIVVCILQILGISFSFQTNEWNGIKLYELRTLRKDKHFTFLQTAIITILLLVACVICYFTKCLIGCFGTSICAIILCLYVLKVEMPLLMMNQKALLEIIKDNIISALDPKEIIQGKYNVILEKLIYQKDIKTIYNLFCDSKDIDYNKKLLYALLDLQASVAFNLDTISNKEQLKKAAFSITTGIKECINGSFDIIHILGNNTKDYLYYITRAIFRLMESEYAKDVIAKLCEDEVWINYKQIDKEQKMLYANTMIIVSVLSVKSGDFRFVSELRKQYSMHFFGFNKDISALIFAELSFFFYYLVSLSDKAPNDLREKVKAFIEDEGIQGNVEIFSWKKLFQEFSDDYNLDYSEFAYVFNYNSDNMEYLPFSGLAQFVTLSESIANDWYLANLLNKDNCFNDDYGEILRDLTKGEIGFYFEEFVKENFDEGRFQPSEKIKEIVRFYSGETTCFDCFTSEEEMTHKFYNYYERLKREMIEAESLQLGSISNTALTEKYRPQIEAALQGEWNFDNKIKLSEQDQKYMRFYYYRSSDAINHDEALLDSIIKGVLYDIAKSISPTIIKCNETKRIQELLKQNIEGITNYARHLASMIEDADLRTSYLEKVKNTQTIKSKILSGAYIILKDGYHVNIEINKFIAEDMSGEQLNQMVEQYKRPDGQYLYEGVFMTRQDVAKYLKSKYVVYTLVFSYNIQTSADGIVRLEKS